MSIDLAYAELGLSPGASESEVRAAWRRLVSRWHPDRNTSPEAVAFMQRINSAYERIRLTAFAGAPDSAAQGRTLRRKVRLSLEEAALGCTKVLRGKVTETCVVCSGIGELKPAAPCPDCKGAGVAHGTAWFGWLSTQWTCQVCKGSGVVPRTCDTCMGKGERSSAYRRIVRIPAGVRQGDVLSTQGVAGPELGFAGTLELQVEIAPHRLFESGDDGILRCEMPVDGFAWIANAWIDVPTLTGLQQMRLQRGRRVYRLRGQGLPLERRGTARGDYLVTVVPTFPDTLSAREQALLDQLAQSSIDSDGRAAAGPLRAWRHKVHAWSRGRSGRNATEQAAAE